MQKFIRINKKKYIIRDGVMAEWALQELVAKAQQNSVTVEEMTVQSILQHWLQNDRFRQSDPSLLNTLFSFLYDMGYDEFKIANGKIRVLALDETRRAVVAPGDMELS